MARSSAIKSTLSEYGKVNEILYSTSMQALGYLVGHDQQFKQYCLQLASWDAVDKLAKLESKLNDPLLLGPIREFLKICQEAKSNGQDENIGREGFPIAGREILKLVRRFQSIGNANPDFREGIDPDKMATLAGYKNIEKLAQSFANK